MALDPLLKHFHELGLILVPMTVVKEGAKQKKQPLIEYKGYAKKGQDLTTLQGLYETYKDIKPLHRAVYCVNGVIGGDFDCPKDYETFFNSKSLDTLTIKSPSGGYHPFYRTLVPCKTFKIFGLEIKVDQLCTIAGDGYELIKNVPIKEIQNIEDLVLGLYPKVKSHNIPKSIKDIKVSDVIKQFVKKEKEGHNYWTGLCPVHGDNTHGHLYIYEDTNSWFCYKCWHGGDAVEFIAFRDQITRKEAIKKLEELFSITIANSPFRFFDGNKFIPRWLGDEILRRHFFRTTQDTGECYVYKDGLYIAGGEAIIQKEANNLLGDKSTIHRINETINYVKISTYIERKEINKDPFLINLQNGVFDLQTNELKPHSSDIVQTVRIPIFYDPSADCPKIKQFFSEVVAEDDIPALEEFFGYCLYRDYLIHKAFMLVGGGANGKSTVLRLLLVFLGSENCAAIPLQDLETNRFATGSLFGKLANIYADLSPKALSGTALFKMLTGQDLIDAEIKFGGRFKFVNYAKMIFSANKIPTNYDDTNAFFRRWFIINFPNVFEGTKKDSKLIEKLTTPQELSGLFNLAIKALIRLLARHEFSNQKSTEKVRNQYIRMSDSVHAFILDKINISPEKWIEKKELYQVYTEYCRNNKLISVSDGTFSKNLIKHVRVEDYRPDTNKGRIRAWKGIEIKEPENVHDVQGVQDFSLSNCAREENQNISKKEDKEKHGHLGQVGQLAIDKAAREWEELHNVRINQENIAKVTFTLKQQFPGISADDLAKHLRRCAKIPQSGNDTCQQDLQSESKPATTVQVADEIYEVYME